MVWLSILLIAISHESYLVFFICFLLLSMFFIRFNNIKNKIKILAKLFCVLVIITPIALIYNHLEDFLQSKDKESNEKHLVLVVIDGWPTNHMHTYNPDVEESILDSVFKKGIVFYNFYTSFPSTARFFATLYSGNSNFKEIKNSLLLKLKSEKIQFKTISSHRNSLPEGSELHSNKYNGLRSYFLTQNMIWIPKYLGLDYSVFLTVNDDNIGLNETGKIIYRYLNPQNNNNDYMRKIDDLTSQVLINQSKKNKSLTIIHLFIGHITSEYQEIHNHDISAQHSKGINVQKIRDNNYRYDERDELYAKELNTELRRKSKNIVSKQLELLLRKLNDSRVKSTIILTADHGTMYGKGRFWYTYHPNEEVIKVPFILFNKNESGRDNRFFNTQDLSYSILDFFGIKTSNSNAALSIFNKKKKNKYVTTLTVRSDIHKEFFLIISGRPEGKYQINLHPQGDAKIKLIKVDNYEENIVKEFDKIPEHIQTIIVDSISNNKYLEKNNIHYKFR